MQHPDEGMTMGMGENTDPSEPEENTDPSEPIEPEYPEDPVSEQRREDQKILALVNAIHKLDPDDEDEFSPTGIPLVEALADHVDFDVTPALRDRAWAEFTAPEVRPPPIEEKNEDVVEVTENGETVTYNKSDFTYAGEFKDGDRFVSHVWRHKSGVKYYEDVMVVRARGLPIYPFSSTRR